MMSLGSCLLGWIILKPVLEGGKVPVARRPTGAGGWKSSDSFLQKFGTGTKLLYVIPVPLSVTDRVLIKPVLPYQYRYW